MESVILSNLFGVAEVKFRDRTIRRLYLLPVLKYVLVNDGFCFLVVPQQIRLGGDFLLAYPVLELARTVFRLSKLTLDVIQLVTKVRAFLRC